MQKYIVTTIGLFILLSFGAQAQEVDGLWLAPSKPGYQITAVDGPANAPDEALGISILSPNFTTWGVFYGIKTGEVIADLIPSITNSDMRARWSSSGLNGTLVVQSCTQNCPFNAGETIDLVKAFGNGVVPPGEEPPPDSSSVCSEELCAADSALAARCEDFLSSCLLVEDEDECVGGALLICRNLL